MANITATDVNKLRKMTGAGMMDCKNALVESEGDFDVAIEILRKKGQKVAAKRADREATEGIVLAKTNSDHSFGGLVIINSETDFVANSVDFVTYANKVIDLVVENKPASIENLRQLDMNGRSVEENLTELVGKTGEKLDLAAYNSVSAAYVSAYIHQGSKLATLVALNKNGFEGVEQLAHDLAMQVAAMNPVAVDKDDVDPAMIEKELEIGREQAKQEGKPESMLDKIAAGKLNRFFKDNTLMGQDFIKDSSKTVAQYVESFGKDLKVLAIYRQKLGD